MLSSAFGKMYFIRHFILNGKIDLWLTISYQKQFVVSVPVLSFQIFTAKLILWPKMGLTCAISIVNWILDFFLFKKIFCFSSLILNY